MLRTALMLLVTAFGSMVPAAALAGGEPRSPQGEYYYRLWNDHTENCVLSRGTGNGSPVVHWEGCKNESYLDQRWALRLAAVGGGHNYYYIVNQHSQKCLLARTSNHLAVQWDCMAYADQMWRFRQDQDGYFQLINKESGQCLVAADRAEQAFTHPCVYWYNDQWWYLSFD